MRLLLDTHVLIWWLEDDPRLKPKPRAIIARDGVQVFFSVASCWEASIKAQKGKIPMAGSDLWRLALDEGFAHLAIEPDHIVAMENLPKFGRHKDPFDQLLLAQAKAEGAALMTADRILSNYGVPCIGVA